MRFLGELRIRGGVDPWAMPLGLVPESVMKDRQLNLHLRIVPVPLVHKEFTMSAVRSRSHRPCLNPVRRPVLGVLAATLCAAAVVAPATAQIQVFTDQAQWQSAAGLFNTDGLQSEVLGNHPTPYNTVGGWNINTLAGGITIQVFDNGSVDGSRELHFRDFGAQVRFTGPNGPYGAMGLNYRTSNEAWQLKLDGNIVATLPGNTNGFIGFTSNPPRQNFVLTSPSNVQGGISVDNIAVGVRNYGSLFSGAADYMRNHVPISPSQRLNRNYFEALVAAGQDYLISQGVDFLDASAMATNALQMVQNAGYYYNSQGVTYYGSPVVTDEEISRLANMAATSGTLNFSDIIWIDILATSIRDGSDDLSEARDYAASTILPMPLAGNCRIFSDLVANMCIGSYGVWNQYAGQDVYRVRRAVAAAVAGALIPAAGPPPPISPYIVQGAATILAAANSIAAGFGTAVSPNAALPSWHDYELFAMGVAIVDVSGNEPSAGIGCCLGSTGNDGVRIAAPAGGNTGLGFVGWNVGSLVASNPGAVLRARHEVVSNSGTTLVGMDFTRIAANNWRTAPFNISSSTYRLEIYNGNTLVTSFANRSGVANEADQPPNGISPYHIGGTGQDGIQAVVYPAGTHITVGAQVFVGTEVRLIPEGTHPTGTSVSGIQITGTGVPEIQFTDIGPPIRCPGDFNHDGAITSQDFFDFISAFFSGSITADFNGDGVLSSQDFFDFIVAFFQGC